MSGTIDLQTAAVLATFDQLSYNPNGMPLPGQQMPTGWEPIPLDKGGVMVDGSFSAYAYRNVTTGQVVIAYTGTNGMGDLAPDISTLAGNWSNQFTLATNYAASVRAANPNAQRHLPGFSR